MKDNNYTLRSNRPANRRTLFAVILLSLMPCCVFAADIDPQPPIPDFRLPAHTFFKPDNHYKGNRKVFAWYMVCCGPFGGMDQPRDGLIRQYKAEIQMAQSMGIDGFGLDIMEPNDSYRNAIDAIFEAAKELNTGFSLFFECDYGAPKKAPGDYAALLEHYASHPNYFKVDGRPLLCAYGADCGPYGLVPAQPVSWWRNSNPVAAIQWWKTNVIDPVKATGIDVYFIPTTWWQLVLGGGDDKSSLAEMTAWGDIAQGNSLWQIGNSPVGTGLGVLNRQATFVHSVGKTWMGTVQTHYWWGSYFSVPSWHWNLGDQLKPDNSNRNGRYFEHEGGMGLEKQWDAVMNVQKPEWVMLLTWNDFNESYIEPVDDYKKYHNGVAGGVPLGWYKPQAGMDELNRYYIQWYKTGSRPQITSDSIFYAYVTQSSKTIAAKDPRPPVEWGNCPPADNIFITTALTSPAKLRVTSGTSTSEFDVPDGITQTKVPSQVGAQTFSIWRNGKQVESVDGEPIVGTIDFYDYWPTTGFVEFHADNRKAN